MGNALLNLAALGGAACIALVLLALVCDISLIMFKTGSMSPTIPAGSVAVVREISADDVSVGDVLTVERPGDLPVTHRVTSVSGEGEMRTITMRGDANDFEDADPYTISQARIVLFSVPGLARVIVWFSNPWVLGSLTLLTSGLVTWAFWPREPRVPRVPRGPRSRYPQHAVGGPPAAVLAIVAVVVSALAAHSAPAAHAVPSEEVVRGEHLTVVSIRDAEAMQRMAPGESATWQLGARIDGAERSEIDIALAATGSSRLGLTLEMRACSERWEGSACRGTEAAVAAQGPVDVDGGFVPLVSMERELWLLIVAKVPEQAEGRVDLGLRVTGWGEEVTVGPDVVGSLPSTGADLLGPVLLGAGAVVLGIAAAVVARRFTRSEADT